MIIKKIKEEILYQGNWLNFCKKNGHEYIKRKKCSGIAIIIAVNKDNKIILTEQYRIAVNSFVLELPAGLAGDEAGKEDESILEAAKRELLEETGYQAKSMIKVTQCPVSPGLSNEIITFFYTDDIVKKHKGGGNENENITVHEVSLNELDEYIEQSINKDLLIDSKIYIAQFFIKKFRF